jgi:hypothetical protein
MKNTKFTVTAIAGIALLAGCATNVKKPVSEHNPPPAEAFSKFGVFELKPINTVEGCDKQHGADVALRSIQDQMKSRLGYTLANWSSANAKTGASRKLIIEPICSDAKLVGTNARIWGGALAGSSAIVLKVRYTDASTQKTIAEPVFYQRANAMGAAWSFGATDRNMLTRIVDLMVDYTTTNYQAAVGGPTGL